MPNLEILNAPLRRSQIWGRSASGIGDMRSAERRSASEALLLFPVWKKREVGGGVSAMDMVSAWIETVDVAMAAALPPEKLAQMKIRERIRSLVQFRLDAVAGQEEALRRGLAIMSMPQNAARAVKLGWNSADVMWRLAGDTATDYNHYTKRAILASIYGATLAVFVDDQSEGKEDTRTFLDRRIEGVMTFEKVKAKWLGSERESFSVTRFLGRLRYPAR